MMQVITQDLDLDHPKRISARILCPGMCLFLKATDGKYSETNNAQSCEQYLKYLVISYKCSHLNVLGLLYFLCT